MKIVIDVMPALYTVKDLARIGDEIMTEQFDALAIEERAEVIRSLLKLIDQQIKKFVSDICKDVGFSYENLYIKTDLDKTLYSISLYKADTQRMAKYTWSIDEFLLMCQDKEQLEYRMNEVIRRLILKMQYDEQGGIVF